MSKFIDLSHTLMDAIPVYPGDSETRLVKTNSLDTSGYTNHRVEIGMHVGTHIDTPMHMLESSSYISQFPLVNFIGNGCVLDVRGQDIIEYKSNYSELVKEDDIVLLYTGQNVNFGSNEYFKQHPVVDPLLAEFFISKNIKMLGMDTPSPDRYPFKVHKMLFEKNILIIENLTNLHELLNLGSFEIIALPLNIKADASMARVIARVKEKFDGQPD